MSNKLYLGDGTPFWIPVVASFILTHGCCCPFENFEDKAFCFLDHYLSFL